MNHLVMTRRTPLLDRTTSPSLKIDERTFVHRGCDQDSIHVTCDRDFMFVLGGMHEFEDTRDPSDLVALNGVSSPCRTDQSTA